MSETKFHLCSPHTLTITTHLICELTVLRMEQRSISSCFTFPPEQILHHEVPSCSSTFPTRGSSMSCKSGWRLILFSEGSSTPRPDWKFSLFPSWKYRVFILYSPKVLSNKSQWLLLEFFPTNFSLLTTHSGTSPHPSHSISFPYVFVNKVRFSASSRTTSPQLQ